MYLSYASYRVLSSFIVNLLMSFLIFVVLSTRKNLVMNAYDKACHVVIDLRGLESSQTVALSWNEKGNSLSFSALFDTSFNLKASHIYKNLAKYACRFLAIAPHRNWLCWIMCMIDSLILNLIVLITGLTTLLAVSLVDEIA